MTKWTKRGVITISRWLLLKAMMNFLNFKRVMILFYYMNNVNDGWMYLYEHVGCSYNMHNIIT